MKGIQKLFLGLFLMALISVGFKVEAKAAATAPTVTHDINATGGVDFTFTAAISTTETDAFPKVAAGNTAAFVYECKVYSIDDSGSSLLKTVYVELKNANGTKTIGYNTNGSSSYTSGTVTATSASFTFELLGKNDLEADIENCTGPLVYIDANVSGTSTGIPESGSTPCDSFDTDRVVAAGRVTLSAFYSEEGVEKPFPSEAKTVVFSKTSPFYLIKGQKTSPKISVTTKPGPGYKVIKWWDGTSGITTDSEVELTMGTSPMNVRAEFAADPTAVKIDFDGMKILSGGLSVERSYEVNPYTYKQIKYIVIGDSNVQVKQIKFPTAGDHTGKIQIVAPDVASTLTGKMWIGMEDGLEFPAGDVTVVPDATFTMNSSYSFAPSTSNNIIKPSYNIEPDTITYTSSSSDYFTFTTSGANVVVTTKANNGSATIKGEAVFKDIESSGKLGNITKEATTTVSVESLKLKDPIYVNMGHDKELTISLSKFISSGSENANVSVTKYPDIIKVSPTSGAVKDIIITGCSADTKADSLVLSNGQAAIDVTVYPKPTLTDVSISGDKIKFTATIPKGNYHDSIMISSTKGALEFKAVDNDNKTKNVSIDFSDTDNKLSKKASGKEIKFTDINKYLKDICKDKDSQTIEYKVYVYKNSDELDKDVCSEKKEFTVYKINLDTSGNASYTVNGENVGGYFYGISDATYTIKSTATNGGKLDTTKSGDFNSGESISYKVLGARTLKAVYNASGSNANANGAAGAGMDGYDDVPKTGESRTDIWILWSVLLVSILGAGFMIWKRFGLVRAIAAADQEMAQAQEKERVEAEKKAEKDKMDMLKDLRNL